MAKIQATIGLKDSENNLMLNKSSIVSMSSLTQLNVDPQNIYYGVVSNTGNIEILDKDSQIKTMVENEKLDNSNSNIKLIVNNQNIQLHKSVNSNYKDNILNIELSDTIKDFSKITISDVSTLTFEKINGKELLTNVIFKYTKPKFQPTISSIGSSIVVDYGLEEFISSLDYLEQFKFNLINGSEIEGKSLEEVLNYFCQATQTNIIQMKNGDIGVALARPIYSVNLIKIPKKYIITNGETSLFLNNKYKRVTVESLDNYTGNYKEFVFSGTGLDETKYTEENTFKFGKNPFVNWHSGVKLAINHPLHEYLGKTVLYDYTNGIRTKEIEIFCSDLYYYGDPTTKAKNWEKGDVLEVGDIIAIENETYLNGDIIKWKVTGREFVFNGYPKLKLYLQECFWVNNLDNFVSGLYQNRKMVYTWKQLVDLGLVEVNGTTLVDVSEDLEGDLVVSNEIITIGANCFAWCEKLNSVELLDNTRNILSAAFAHCTSLKGLFLPKTMVGIGDYSIYKTFDDCPNLTIYTAHTNLFDYSKVSFTNTHNCSAQIVNNSIKMIPTGSDPYTTIATINVPAGNYYYSVSSNHPLEIYIGTNGVAGDNYNNKAIMNFKQTNEGNLSFRIDGQSNGAVSSQIFADISIVNMESYGSADKSVIGFGKFWNCYNSQNNETFKFCPVEYNFSRTTYEIRFGITNNQ